MLRLFLPLMTILSIGCSVAPAPAQNPVPPLTDANSFPFVLPWDDGKAETATDVSFLNTKPAGKNGAIVVKEGRFVEETTGKRVRFFGVNITAKGAFPSKADADKIAARLAKLGINIVRFHHINNGWDTDGGTLWKREKTFLEIDPAQLDKLDYFITALKKQGIYTNINLQTAREYVPELGFPESVRQIPNFQKQVDKVNRKMIQLQKDFARQLLDRKNPYTELKYADDPALMVLEINNENSLVGAPWEKLGSGPLNWPEPFKGELGALWNTWLKKTYMTDTALAKAWPAGGGRVLNEKNLITDKITWTTENQSKGDVEFKQLPLLEGSKIIELRTVVKSNPGPNWHVQAHLGGLDLENGKDYTLYFFARADKETTIGVDARLNKPDWRNVGLNQTIKIGPKATLYRLPFRVQDAEPNASRVSFVLGDARGAVSIFSVKLSPGVPNEGLRPDESLDKGTVALPTESFSRRWRDYLRFLTDTERAYSEEMRAFLRDDLGFKKASIIDTQISWGGTAALTREQNMEFADNHQYWNHPEFPGGGWDPKNYRVNRRALVNELKQGGGTLAALAKNRIAGKPYSVSEYNHPAPSDYQCEMMPLYATFAAFQDWDMIYVFDWGATGTGVQNEKYEGYFDSARNPAKSAFFPAAALIFRNRLLPSLPWSHSVRFFDDPRIQPASLDNLWKNTEKGPLWLSQRLGIKTNEAEEVQEKRPVGFWSLKVEAHQGDPAQPATHTYLASNPNLQVVAGFVGGKKYSTVQASFEFGVFGANFAGLMLTTRDDMPLQTTKSSLLTIIGRVENQNMGWNAERTSVSDQWGEGPVRAEFVPCKVSFTTDGPREVYALNPDGTRKSKLDAIFQPESTPVTGVKVGRNGKLEAEHAPPKEGKLSFTIGPEAKSIWFEIVKK